MYDLKGKIALVTGAAGKRGFGRAIALRLATEGADVTVVDKFVIPPRDEDLTGDWKGLDSVVDEIKVLGCQALAITCDIALSNEVDKMIKEVLAKFGQIDVLVNNAGVLARGTIDNITDEIWNANISVNLTGTFFCSRTIAREMIKRDKGGRIINISSQLGKFGIAEGHIGYCASKFGVIGLTQALAFELAPYGITVNAVCPGMADTDSSSEFYKTEAQREGISKGEFTTRLFTKRIADIPLRRLTTPEDVANMVAFLASRETDYITGQSINVNGGRLMAH